MPNKYAIQNTEAAAAGELTAARKGWHAWMLHWFEDAERCGECGCLLNNGQSSCPAHGLADAVSKARENTAKPHLLVLHAHKCEAVRSKVYINKFSSRDVETYWVEFLWNGKKFCRIRKED